MHYCTWQRCGAPATKKIRIRIRHPENIIDTDGNPIEGAGDGRDLWRCDPHYEEAIRHWSDPAMEEVFIIEW